MKRDPAFEYELLGGIFPGDYSKRSRGKVWPVKSRIFLLLVIMALVCGGLAAMGWG